MNEEAIAFGYRCQECGKGTVQENVIPEFATKIRGFPFVVRGAHIGVCDVCGAEHFSARETERWEGMFEDEHASRFLTPSEIQEIRKSLGASMERFAFLIGCTRQSLYNWERPDRKGPQARMADLLMKLVRESRLRGPVDVVRFLQEEAKGFGISLELAPGNLDRGPTPLVLHAQPRARSSGNHGLAQMAADTEEAEIVLLSQSTGGAVGRLNYDFATACLELNLFEPLPFSRFRAEVRFKDGVSEGSDPVSPENLSAVLLSHTTRNQHEVSEVILMPEGDHQPSERGPQ